MAAEDDYWEALPETLSSRDLQELLNMRQTTVSAWLRDGKIPGHRIGSSWIVFRNEVRAWLESTSTVPVPEHEPYEHPLDKYGLFLEYKDLMVLFNKARPTIFGWLKDGTVPAMNPGGRYLIEKNALRRLLEETSNKRPDYTPPPKRDRNPGGEG